MTEPLWVDPTPLVRWVMPWCRVGAAVGEPFRTIAHAMCPGRDCNCDCGHRRGER